MSGGRGWKIVRRVVLGVVGLVLLVWLGGSAVLHFTVAKDVPYLDLTKMVGGVLVESATCAISDCGAELIEGMELAPFAEDLVEETVVSLDVDEVGRVYVAETARQRRGTEDNRSHEYWLLDDLASRTIEDRQAYYEKALAEGRFESPDHFTEASDRLVLLEDLDRDGRADRRSVLAEWNEMVSGLASGVLVREGTAWVTSIPSVYRLEDDDGDGIPDATEEILRGFGVKTSLIGHDLHGLVWGPDGKLYFSMGDRGYHLELPDGRILEPTLGPGRGAVFRMNPDGSEVEIFATGVRNPQELAFDDYGNLFTGDNNGDGGDRARLVHLVEGGETGWAMPYQSLAGDYVRGPWMAERLWELQHDTQPAWVLPPVAYIGNGPAGFAHYPGLGLPDRYANHFFLCDYAYTNSRSGIWSFAVEPRGASFEMVDLHPFIWSLLATDFDFAWDGRMFATIFNQFGNSRSVVSIRHPESQADVRVGLLADAVRGPIGEETTARLLELIGFPDQRLRLRAQFELAARGATDELVELALDDSAERVPRLHAIWGLGQIGEAGVRALVPEGLDVWREQPAELRAQLAKVVGEARVASLAPALRAWLEDDEARVRFFAAQSLGAIGDAASVAALFELLRDNADEDVYLRHAAVWALHRIGQIEAVWARRDDASRSVRLGVLLVLRQAGDPRIEHFLADQDELLVVEAARAIYDWPIAEAMPALAALAEGLEPARAGDRQTSQALHRRVIGANEWLRSSAGATALAHYVADERQLEALRSLALEALGRYGERSPRDLTMGFYRPIEPADPGVLAGVFRASGRALVESSLGGRALEIANRIGELPLDDEELLELSSDTGASPAARVSALDALAARAALGEPGEPMREASRRALMASSPRVRVAARELLLVVDPGAGLDETLRASRDAETAMERARAWRRLGLVDDKRAWMRVAGGVADWERGALEEAVALEVLEAATRHPDPSVVDAAERILAGSSEAPVESRRWALAGGDPAVGREIFQGYGDCQRCHGSGGHGAGAGPSLAGVSDRGARHVLESILVPQARIAEGFATVTVNRRDGKRVSGLLVESSDTLVTLDVGETQPVRIPRSEIDGMSEPVTGMPAIGLALEPAALRDVVAYVMSLPDPAGGAGDGAGEPIEGAGTF